MAKKNAVIRAKISGVLTDLMVKTGAENVVFMDGDTEKTLAAKLSEILTDLSSRATKTEMSSAISSAIDGLIAGAPGTYDTLKEIADYIAAHEEVSSALNAAIGNKVDKEEGKGLSTNDLTNELLAKINGMGALAAKDQVSEVDLDTALAEKVNAAAQGNHSHENKAVLDTITQEKVTKWDSAITGLTVNGTAAPVEDGTAAITTPLIFTQDTEPAGMKDGDVWFQTLE